MARAHHRFSWISSVLLMGLAGCTNCGGKTNGGGPTDTTTQGTGSVTVNGVAKEYTVKADDSHFYLLVKKQNASQCNFFHHHAVAALGFVFDFNLDKANPDGSHFNLTVAPAGLDLDKAEWRNVFPDTNGTTFTESERSDSRANMMDQLDAAHFSTMTFNAHNLTTLDGTGTAPVEVNLKGSNSTLTLNATASWVGDQLTITGTGTLDGTAHSMPVGTFKDCIDPTMGMDLRLVLIPGSSGHQTLPDGGPAFQQTTYPDMLTCAPVGWQSVERSLAVRCGGCHANPPTQGATVPLATYDDYRVNTHLFPNGPIYQDLPGRLTATDGRRMPPATSTQIPQGELDLINAWVNGGAALHECNADGGVKPLPDGGSATAVDAGPPPACGSVGYDIDIVPLMNQHCVSCHSPTGGSVPLDTYASGFAATTATAYRPMNRWQSSAARLADGTMWPNAPASASAAMSATFATWVSENLPQGKCNADGGVITPPDAGSSSGGPVDAGPPPACGVVGFVDVQPTLTNYCTSCHRAGGSRSQSPLDSYAAGFATAPAPFQNQTIWQAAAARIADRSMPVGVNVPQAEIDTFTQWVGLNVPLLNCTTGGPADAGPIVPTCNSNSYAPGPAGNPDVPQNSGMQPGVACIACHTAEGGPEYRMAGTVMGLLHDQDLCRSPVASGITSVKIHVTPVTAGAFNAFDINVNSSGNFYRSWFLPPAPAVGAYKVALTYLKNGTPTTRPMVDPPTDGDCNACHTDLGTNGAPGRITPFP